MTESYGEAARRAKASRERFLGDLSATRARVTPARLSADLRHAVRAKTDLTKIKAGRAVRDHRLGIAAAVIALLSWSFRRPLTALSRRSWVALKEKIAARRERKATRSVSLKLRESARGIIDIAREAWRDWRQSHGE